MSAKVWDRVSLAVSLVLLFALWEGASRLLRIPTYILPAPSKILLALKAGLATGITARDGYWLHMSYTIMEALAGFVLGSGAGLLLGMLLSQFPRFERLVYPYITAFQSLPKVAVAPMIVLWFGFGVASKIVIVALLTFFPVLVNAHAGFQSTDPEALELLHSLVANRWQIFRKVQFPSALPYIFAGLDMALVYSVIGAIVGEFVGAQRGLGVLIMQMNASMDLAGAFSVFVVLSVIGVLLNLALRWARRRTLFWSPVERKTIGL